jgi:hypothetical protein
VTTGGFCSKQTNNKATTIQSEDWMTEGDGLTAGVAKEPTKKLLVEWIVVT